MAKKKKEKVTEEVVKEKNEEKVETPQIDLEKFDSKDDSSVTKVDLSKPPPTVKKKEEEKEEVKEEVKQDLPIEEVKEEVEEEVKEVETPILEEVTSEKTEEEIIEQTEKIAEEASEAIAESQETGEPLPENVQKLVDFMNETGGDIQDYVMLNQDYSQLNEESLLREYYKNTKPHLDNEEIDFLMEDQFHYDEDEDDEKDIKRKRLALKEQVASARAHLDGQKSKYYEDIKAGSKLTPEQKDAIDFFNRYTEESKKNEKIVKEQNDTFINKTNQVFNDKF